MKNLLNTAVIGVGGMGTNHCRLLSKISNLLAVCDKNEERALRTAHKYKCQAHTSIKSLLEMPHLDAIVVAVNTQFHLDVGLEVIKHKIPLLIEKPLAVDLKQAKLLCDAAKKRNVFLMAGMIERYNPVIMKIKSDIDSNFFGDLYQIVSLRIGIEPPNMVPRSVDMDLAVHDVDILDYLLNKTPKSVVKTSNAYLNNSESDASKMLMTYGDTSATIITNWVSPIKMRKMYIFGQHRSAEVDILNQEIQYFSKIPIRVIEKQNYYQSFRELSSFSKKIIIKKSEPLMEELKTFLLNEGGGYKKEFCENGLRAIKIIESAKRI